MSTLKRWSLPPSYIGTTWDEYFVAPCINCRDADPLMESNWAYQLEYLGGESDTVIAVSENHFLVGWISWVAIHEDDVDALLRAEELMLRLENYPVLDEDDLSSREFQDDPDCYNPETYEETE